MPDSSSVEITDPQIRDHLAPFGISLTERQAEQIRAYLLLLVRWNRSINLTTITDATEIVERHFGESMYASNLLPVENCRLADVGSGAGFPGLAIKIVSPSIQLILIESNSKKCAFLTEVVRSLGLSDVEVLQQRFEDIHPDRIRANVITARAVGGFKELTHWSGKALSACGHLALWVGSDDSTRIAQTNGWTWQPPARIPGSKGRFILIGRPVQ